MGIGFFIGIQATGDDMKKTIENYFLKNNLADLQVRTSLGVSEELAEELSKILDSEKYELTKEQEFILKDYNRSTIKLISNPKKLNNLEFINGENKLIKNEIFLDYRFAKQNSISIGDEIKIENDNLKYSTFKVKALVKSPLFITFDRGKTKLSHGILNTYAYVDEDVFNLDFYTSIYFKVANYNIFSKEYKKDIDLKIQEIEKYFFKLKEIQKDIVVKPVEEKLKEAKLDLQTKINENKTKFNKAEEKINDAEIKLNDAKIEIESSLNKFEESFNLKQNDLDNEARLAKIINQADFKFKNASQEILNSYNQIEESLKEIREKTPFLTQQLKEIEDNIIELDNQKSLALRTIFDLKENNDTLINKLLINKDNIRNLNIVKQELLLKINVLNKNIETTILNLNNLLTQENFIVKNSYFIEELEVIKKQFNHNDALIKEVDNLIINLKLLEELEEQRNLNVTEEKQLKDIENELLQKQEQVNNSLVILANNYNYIFKATNFENRSTELSEFIEIYFEKNKETIEFSKKNIENILQDLLSKEEFLVNSKKILVKKENELISQKEVVYKNIEKLKNGIIKYNQSLNDYLKAKKEYLNKVSEFNNAIEKAEKEVIDKTKKLDEVKVKDIYLSDINEFSYGFNGYKDDGQRIEKIGKVFPLFFFFISTLISLVTTKRIISEDRLTIGTYYALGYSKKIIRLKYLFYSFIVFSIAMFIGLILGYFLIPKIIYNAYRIMYDSPNIVFNINYKYLILPLILSFISSFLITILSLNKILKLSNAMMLRPENNQYGQRIFIERINLFWRNINFLNKISLRNLFRNKLRLFMSIFGIAGCMGLLLTGFGLDDSISSVAFKQFESIYKFNGFIFLKEDVDDLQLKLDKNKVEYDFIHNSLYKVSHEKKNMKVPILVFEDEKIDKYINLVFKNNKVNFKNNSVVINEKLAKLLGVEIGDVLEIEDSDLNIKFNLKITDINENYVGHNIYVSKDVWNKNSDNYRKNAIIYKHKIIDDNFKANLLNNDYVLTVIDNYEIYSKINESMSAFYIVMFVIVISAGILAFVVMFNLSSMNLYERVREIATLKVLGFRKLETASYLFRENLIILLIGIFLGLFFGKALHYLVISTAEIDNLVFVKQISLKTYVITILLTVIFNLVNEVITIKRVNKIDMLLALKTVE